jgi:EAL domain-containing protein (putative c-di-GMP-specific phosphodiesterase class I)/DNA-binding NarL/FixJ family response regulator
MASADNLSDAAMSQKHSPSHRQDVVLDKVLLLVDDEPSILRSLQRLFYKAPYTVITAGSGYEALDIIRDQPVSVLVSDYSMPNITGAEMLALARSIRPEMYTIVLSGNNDQQSVIRSINDGGASKFIAKPWDENELLSTVAEGFERWASQHYSLQIPGLLNRTHFLQSLKDAVSNPYLSDYVLVYMQLCDSQAIRQIIGFTDEGSFFHQLIEQSQASLPPGFTLGMINDSTIAAFARLADFDEPQEAIIERLLAAFPATMVFRHINVPIAFSVGYSVSSPTSHAADALANAALVAVNRASRENSSRYIKFDRHMQSNDNKEIAIKSELPGALSRDELSLVYQPKIRLSDNSLCGAEALLRWNNPALGEISPVTFIPVAEQLGAINSIGEWVMKTAAQQWFARGTASHSRARISVNVSSVQLAASDFINQVATAISCSTISAELFELELTETQMMRNVEDNIVLLRELRELGIKISIDDFGTGYSSLNYLNRLPLDVLKIDRSFIHPLAGQKSSANLVRNLIQLGSDLGLEIVAEGVETLEQLEMLRAMGCHVVQGYYFSKPLALADFERFESSFDSAEQYRTAG